VSNVITVNRNYRFCASHRLHVQGFENERNQELFGKCNNPFGHGHNYEIEISVEGPIDELTGRAVDLATLDGLVERTIVKRYDHRNLNEELPEFAKEVPTTENLGLQIQGLLREGWASAFPAGQPRLRRIRIFETERNIFEVAMR
jgi:6-pyruvoyltetrahydropterin/6-carboxytetrahydropterin synthase